MLFVDYLMYRYGVGVIGLDLLVLSKCGLLFMHIRLFMVHLIGLVLVYPYFSVAFLFKREV